MKPFITKRYIEPKGIDKLLKKIPEENFLVDINNLLADKPLDEISTSQIRHLTEKYKLKDAPQKFKNELSQMQKDFLTQHLGVPGDEYNDFGSAQKLQNILGISADDFNKQYKPLVKDAFKKQVTETLDRAKKYQDEEANQFEQLSKQLNLTANEADQVVNEVRQTVVQNFVSEMISDARVSPEEINSFEQLCKNMQVTIESESRKQLDKYQALWTIENGTLPVCEADIFLQKNELCHFKANAKLYENRKVTTGVQYAGPTYRFKIAKGFYYRMGDIKTVRKSQDVMTLIDSGVLYITNKRIIFNGGKGNKTIRYNQIIDLTPLSDGVEIIKETGKPPTFALDNPDGLALTATIARIITDNQR